MGIHTGKFIKLAEEWHVQSEMKMDKHLVQLESKLEKTLDIIKLIEGGSGEV